MSPWVRAEDNSRSVLLRSRLEKPTHKEAPDGVKPDPPGTLPHDREINKFKETVIGTNNVFSGRSEVNAAKPADKDYTRYIDPKEAPYSPSRVYIGGANHVYSPKTET